jgi:4-amino-4-deoxy-L-arabinose transferase-like glycosyltransferase
MADHRSHAPLKIRISASLFSFIVICGLILTRPMATLQDFDQALYITIAYDLDRYGTFSNGIYADAESDTDLDSTTPPPAGMFFGPVYPMLVYAAMQLDTRFRAAVRCSVAADRDDRDDLTCDRYELPMRLLNAFMLTIAVMLIASTAELLFPMEPTFLLSAAAALVAVACEAAIFSYIMTEATIFCVYSLFAFFSVRAWKSGRTAHYLLAGVWLGLLCLTKPSFLIQFPLALLLGALVLVRSGRKPTDVLKLLSAFSIAFGCLVGGWIARNAISVGKLGFTEEYGSAVLIERFAYNTMSVREFFQAFPYCTPGLGELAFDKEGGNDSTHRFVYWTNGSFFHLGRDRRGSLLDEYGRLDPQISGIAREEMRTNWWGHLLVSIPLAWCGLWAGWIASLFLVPLFVWACLRSLRERPPMFVFYALPALLNLALDGLIGNHYTRYNLILIGPYAIGAASLFTMRLERARWRWPFRAPASLSTPSASAASGSD